jgi:phage regulator Rha-like protein
MTLCPRTQPLTWKLLRSQNATETTRTNMSNKTALAAVKRIDSRILLLRGQKIILDSDLAALYGVDVKHLNQQIKRNRKRFPGDFLFRISAREFEILRSQIVTSSDGHGGRRYLPYAFTEHGAVMAATVLNSERAIQMSIFVVRAFIRMREALATNRQIVVKLAELERRIENHDGNIQELVEAIRELMAPVPPNRPSIGFETPRRGKTSGRTIPFIRSS